MTFQDRFKPTDRAPDWADTMCGERVGQCIMHLKLYGLLTDKEATELFDRAKPWIEGTGKYEA